jgi:hypothetical protein
MVQENARLKRDLNLATRKPGDKAGAREKENAPLAVAQ